VSAPWSVEFNENIIFVINDDLVEVLSNNDFDWSAIVSWNFFTLHEWLDGTALELINELFDVSNSD